MKFDILILIVFLVGVAVAKPTPNFVATVGFPFDFRWSYGWPYYGGWYYGYPRYGWL